MFVSTSPTPTKTTSLFLTGLLEAGEQEPSFKVQEEKITKISERIILYLPASLCINLNKFCLKSYVRMDGDSISSLSPSRLKQENMTEVGHNCTPRVRSTHIYRSGRCRRTSLAQLEFSCKIVGRGGSQVMLVVELKRVDSFQLNHLIS